MAMRDEFTVDPEDSGALVAWTAERTALLRSLDTAQRRVATLDTILATPAAGAAQQESAAAHAALDQARAAAAAAQAHSDAAEAEARRFEANEVAAAAVAADEATLAVSQALAELLRDSAVSTSVTAAVDGLALRERYRVATSVSPPAWDHTTIPFPAGPGDVIDPELTLPAVDPAADSDHRRLLAVLDRLDERVDTVADLTTAESVHQLVAGNATRSGGSLAVAAEGRVPDAFDVIRTPRRGHDVVHRLIALTDPAAPAPWTVPHPGPAAALDPVSTGWAAGLLPDPARITVRLRLVGPDGADLADPLDLPLSALGLDALGWVRVAAGGPELDLRLARAAEAARRAQGDPSPEGRTVVDDTRALGDLGLADLLAAAQATGRVLAAARALAPQDLAHPAAPDAPAPTAAAADRVAQRVRAAETWTVALTDDLEAAAVAAPTTPDPGPLLGRLLDAAAAGVAEALPHPGGPAVPDAALLRALAGAAAGRLRLRLAATPFAADPADPAGTLARARARADELAGMRLPLPAELAPALDPTTKGDLAAGANRLGGADAPTVRAWLLDQARVRPATRALADALDLADVLGATALLDPRVAQLPATSPDTWAGAIATPPPGTVSLVVQATYGSAVPATVAGLVVDEWSQPVADDGHDSGLAFHYDRPDAAPPQAVLVAVHPNPDPEPAPDGTPGTWDLDTLLDVVTSTLALAQDRATAAERAHTGGIEVPDA